MSLSRALVDLIAFERTFNGRQAHQMTRKFSAYLSIYNDWDILPESLQSVASYVDELVVVDGAYEWMVPYLTMLGIDPIRSDRRVYDILNASGIPFRVISKTWKNEVEKRRSGYEACTHDYIYRVDADEVLFFNEKVLEKALFDGLAVGEMQMPNLVAPGWISRARNLPDIECQCFLFDRRRVSPEIHLNYLWLILTADQLPQVGQKPFPVYPMPLAFNAHLTGWRTPRTGVNRASFYTLNWMRKNGVPWLESLRDRPLTNVQSLFDALPPTAFFSSLSRGRIAFGMIESAANRVFTPNPLDAAQESTYLKIYENFMTSLVEMNQQTVSREQPFLTCLPTLLDLTTEASRKVVAPNATVTIRMSAPLNAAKATLLTYTTKEPFNQERDLSVQLNGNNFTVVLPAIEPDDGPMLRQCLEFHVWPVVAELPQRFQIIA